MRGFGLASLCGTGRAVASPSLKDHDQRGAFLHHLSQAEESLRGFKNKALRGSRSRGSKSRGPESRGSKSRGSKSRGSKCRLCVCSAACLSYLTAAIITSQVKQLAVAPIARLLIGIV